MSEEEACDICDGGQSSKKNPIIFCDGEGCNLPVHKICYKVDEIPEDDWYCQRCVAKKRKKTINIICCPKQTGALKQTIVSDSYMHVVCAMWNKSIKDDMEPYSFNKRQLDLQECYICSKKKGICIECDDPSCSTRFHATCAINNGLIIPARSVSADYSPKCSQHQPKPKPKPKRQKRRVIRRKKDITSSEEESEEEESEREEDHTEEEEVEEEEEEEEEELEEEMGNKSNSKPTIGTKRKEQPMKALQKSSSVEKPSPHALFENDQMSTDDDDDDDDDDMGTRSSTPSKLKRIRVENENNNVSKPITASLSHRERFDAKRKKSSNNTDKKPVLKLEPTSSNISSSSISSPTIAPVPTKQKLPNKAHLSTPKPQQRPPSMTPPISRSFNGTHQLDIDAITNSMSSSQRWNNSNVQPSTPHTNATSFFDNDNKLPSTPRRSIDERRLNDDRDELLRLREDVRKLKEFKRAVMEIFTSLKIQVPGSLATPESNIEIFINELNNMLRRVGPMREEDDAYVRECVETVMTRK